MIFWCHRKQIACAPIKNNPRDRTNKGSPNILPKNNLESPNIVWKNIGIFFGQNYGIPLYFIRDSPNKKYNRENHNIWTQRRGLGKFVRWKRGFGILWFVLKMSEPAQVMSTWTFKWKGGLRPRFCFKCFAPCCKITKKPFVRSDFIKTLQHYGFLMKLSAW